MKLNFKIFILFYFISLAYVWSQNFQNKEKTKLVIKKKGISSFELKGKILFNGKPLENVEISLGNSNGSNMGGYYRNSKTGDYDIKITPVNYQDGNVYYYFTFQKDGFNVKHISFNPHIYEKTDTESFVFYLPVEMSLVGKKDTARVPEDTKIFVAALNSALLGWARDKHRFVLGWDTNRSTVKKDSAKNKFFPKLGEKITLKNIFFEATKSKLLSSSFDELNKLADYLNKNKSTTIEINGHTDNTGTEEKNKLLSEARAKAVADYLVSKGIDKLRISFKGYGSTKPIAKNDSEQGKQQNRRVEFIINKK